MSAGGPGIVFQPICRIEDQRIVRVEALSRFPGWPRRPTDQWFDDARRCGMQAEFELSAVRNALHIAETFWPAHTFILSINAAPATILDPGFALALSGRPLDRICLEITEQDRIEDYDALNAALAAPRSGGLTVAIDDFGSGYAGMRHIIEIRPDVLKLDASLIESVDSDPVRISLAAAFLSFSNAMGMTVIAEGVETHEQFAILSCLGVHEAQGYFLMPPIDPELLFRPCNERPAIPAGGGRARSEAFVRARNLEVDGA